MIFQETERTELKRVLNDTIQKEIVAFLNSFDGTIYIGVNDDGIYNNFNKKRAIRVSIPRFFCKL